MSSTLPVALFKTPWVAFGITAPRFIWLAALLILAGTLAYLIRLWWLVRHEERVYDRLRAQFANLPTTYGVPQRDGMASAASQRLGDTVNRLDEHLQDLTDILERLGRVGGGNGRS